MCSLLLCALEVLAQSWCAPGARWHHEIPYTAWGDYGYVETQYVGDVLFADALCQEFVIMEHGYSDQTNSPWEGGPFTMHTTSSPDGLVQLWDGSGFDTLFHFGAVPDDHWLFPPSLNETGTLITVTDTGHADVGGISLRYLAIEATIEDIVFVADTVFERIGPIALYIDIPLTGNFLTDGGYGRLRCYSDDEMSITRVEGPCEIPLGTGGVDPDRRISLYPNPCTTSFELSLPMTAPNTTLTLLDVMGREARTWTVLPGQHGFSTSGIAAGNYVLRTDIDHTVSSIPLIIAP